MEKLKTLTCLAITLFSLTLHSFGQGPSSTPIEPTAAEIQTVAQLARVYGINSGEALENYKMMFNADRISDLKGVYFFEQKKAFEVLAIALPKLKESVKPATINVILEKRTFSHRCFEALILELDQLNAEDPSNDQEGGIDFLKGNIAKGIARWLGLPDSNINGRSQESIAQFSALARQRARAIQTESPY